MAFTPYTGKGMTFTADLHSLTGLDEVRIDDAGKPLAEQLDKTHAQSTDYESVADEMGPKGDQKAIVVVRCKDSTVGVADTQLHHLTLGAEIVIAFATSATSNDDKYDHATMRLQKRVTTCTHDGLATVEGTFEALTLGTWGKVT